MCINTSSLASRTKHPSNNNTPAHLEYQRKSQYRLQVPYLVGNSLQAVAAGNTLAVVGMAVRTGLAGGHMDPVGMDPAGRDPVGKGSGYHTGWEVLVSRSSLVLIGGLLDRHRSVLVGGSLVEGHLGLSVGVVSDTYMYKSLQSRTYVLRHCMTG